MKVLFYLCFTHGGMKLLLVIQRCLHLDGKQYPEPLGYSGDQDCVQSCSKKQKKIEYAMSSPSLFNRVQEALRSVSLLSGLREMLSSPCPLFQTTC